MVLLVLTVLGIRAGSEDGLERWTPLESERALGLIQGGVPLQVQPQVTIAFRESVSHTGSKKRTTVTSLEWHVTGDAYRGPTRLLRERVDSSPGLTVQRDGRTYSVSSRGTRWRGLVKKSKDTDFTLQSAWQRWLRPFNSGAWDLAVNSHPVAEAGVDGEDLRVVFALTSGVLNAWRRGDEVSGLIGWECVFRKSFGEYRLRRIRQLTTPRILSMDEATGNPGWLTNPDVVAGSAPVSVLGAELRVRAQTDLESHIELGGVVFATRMRHVHAKGETVAIVDPTSVSAIPFDPAPFEFRTPESFGTDGVITDKETGETRYYGTPESSPDRALDSMADGIERLHPPPESQISARLIGLVLVLVAVGGLVLMAIRFKR